MVNEILELEYLGESFKRVVLFAYEEYDPTCPRGIHKHNHYKIIEFTALKLLIVGHILQALYLELGLLGPIRRRSMIRSIH